MALPLWLPLLLVICGGCYTFEQVPIEALSPGATVRADVDSAGVRTVGEFTGNPTPSVEGSLVRRDSVAVVLSVWRNYLGGGPLFQPGTVEVPLPREYITDFSIRKLSSIRTGGLLAGIAVGLVVVIRSVWHGAGGGLDPGSPPPII